MAKRSKTTKSRKRARRATRATPEVPPGSLVDDEAAPDAMARVFAYGPDTINEYEVPVAQLHRDEAAKVLWVDVVGVDDADALARIGKLFGLHPLALEDVNNGGQRPKLEDYDGHFFVVTRFLNSRSVLDSEQISLFVGPGFVVSFQERRGDCFEPIRERLRAARGRVRSQGADYLAYVLLDAVVDHFAPRIEDYGDRLEALEARVIEGARTNVLSSLYSLRHELQILKRTMMAIRDSIDRMRGHQLGQITHDTRTYLRDCHDHAVRALEAIDGWRDFCAALMDLHYARSGQQLNEVMKVLTIISTIFIPLSFVAGVYGMNFDREASAYNMPELGWVFGYPLVLGLMLIMVVAQLVYFRRRGWLGAGG